MADHIRPNSRGWVWIAWTLLLLSIIGVCIGLYGALSLGSTSFDFEKRRILEQTGWAIQYLDAYFLMAVISAIWVQVCSTAKDNESYLVSLERKVDELHKQLVQSNGDSTKESIKTSRVEPIL